MGDALTVLLCKCYNSGDFKGFPLYKMRKEIIIKNAVYQNTAHRLYRNFCRSSRNLFLDLHSYLNSFYIANFWNLFHIIDSWRQTGNHYYFHLPAFRCYRNPCIFKFWCRFWVSSWQHRRIRHRFYIYRINLLSFRKTSCQKHLLTADFHDSWSFSLLCFWHFLVYENFHGNNFHSRSVRNP